MAGFDKKYRPKKLSDVHGNESTCSALSEILERKSKPKAYLFTGSSGCGKTTLARILRRGLGCKNIDYKELDTADFSGIDTIRALIRTLRIKPMGKARVALLDECHQLSSHAQNALLKTLEEPPKHAYIILATTQPEKLIKEVKNRCTTFAVKKLDDSEMENLITGISAQEDTKLPKDVLSKLLEAADGSPRAGIVLLDKIHKLDRAGMLEEIKVFSPEDTPEIRELCQAIIKGTGWGKVSKILQSLRGHPPESVRRAVLGYFTACILRDGQGKFGHVLECFLDPFYDSDFPGLVLSTYQAMHGGEE